MSEIKHSPAPEGVTSGEIAKQVGIPLHTARYRLEMLIKRGRLSAPTRRVGHIRVFPRRAIGLVRGYQDAA